VERDDPRGDKILAGIDHTDDTGPVLLAALRRAAARPGVDVECLT
jgi:hypothetical protein